MYGDAGSDDDAAYHDGVHWRLNRHVAFILAGSGRVAFTRGLHIMVGGTREETAGIGEAPAVLSIISQRSMRAGGSGVRSSAPGLAAQVSVVGPGAFAVPTDGLDPVHLEDACWRPIARYPVVSFRPWSPGCNRNPLC